MNEVEYARFPLLHSSTTILSVPSSLFFISFTCPNKLKLRPNQHVNNVERRGGGGERKSGKKIWNEYDVLLYQTI